MFRLNLLRMMVVLVVFGCSASLWGQACPVDDPNGPSKGSEVRTLRGKLVYHDSLRQWFELVLDAPKCGQKSIELVRGDKGWKLLEMLRGCRVESRGALGISETGYYSLDEYQFVDSITAIGSCERQKSFPDYSKFRPAKEVKRYRVVMRIHYSADHRESEDSPIRFEVTSGGKELQPWQAYASYDLTGGYVLYGHCGKGFMVDEVFGTPAASPGHFDERGDPGDMAMFDPEGPAAAGIHDLELGYTCVRKK